MQTVNMHDAKTHLSRLVEKAVQGEPFIIARDGKPLVKVEALDPAEARPKRRLGSLQGMMRIPDDFDTAFSEEIEKMFCGE